MKIARRSVLSFFILFCSLFFHTFAITSPIRRLEKNTVVNGYQETFNGPLSSDWVSLSGPSYQIHEGTLQLFGAESLGALLYKPAEAKYATMYQDVTMKFRVKDYKTEGSGFGVLVYSSTVGACPDLGSPLTALSLIFDSNNGRWKVAGGVPTFNLLHICVGRFTAGFLTNSTNFPVYPTENPLEMKDKWYWMRIGYYPNQPFDGGTILFNSQNDVFGKIWSDTQLEPDWQLGYDYGGRTPAPGPPGITCYNFTGNASIEVDYILIQAPQLPSITVSESSNGVTPPPAAYQPLKLDKVVKGYQDTFSTPKLNTKWNVFVFGSLNYSSSNNFLRISSGNSVKNSYIYFIYNQSYQAKSGQDIAIKFRLPWVNNSSSTKGRISLVTSWCPTRGNVHNGLFLSFVIRSQYLSFITPHMPFALQQGIPFTSGEWYWMRLGHYENQPFDGSEILYNGKNDVFAKVWSDCQTEPTWQWAWAWSERTKSDINEGWAGFANSVDTDDSGSSVLDIAYVLVQSPNLNEIPISQASAARECTIPEWTYGW